MVKDLSSKTVTIAFISTVVIAFVLAVLSIPAWARPGHNASYYGGNDGLCGRRVAWRGHVLNCGEYTVAHRTLPFGTKLRVCNDSGTCITAIVTDRGPFVRGRDLDVSLAAAKALGMIKSGTAHLTYGAI